MKRRNDLWKTFAFIPAVSLCILLQACPTDTANESPMASLYVSVLLPAQRTLLPPLDMEPKSFTIAADGPGERRVEVTTTQTGALLEGLELGQWTVTVSALNEGGTVIASGEASVQLVDEGEEELSIEVTPPQGNGSLDLTVQWPATSVPVPSIDAGLLPFNGDSMALDFSIDGAKATCVMGDLSSGYYTLRLKLLSSGSLAAAVVEVVRILKDQTTTGLIDFTEVAGAQGSIRIAITPSLDFPLELEVAGRQAEMGIGRALTLKPWLSEEPASFVCAWYVDGTARSIEETVSLGADLALGVHRMDLAVFSADGRRAGSSGFPVHVVSPFPLGSLSLQTFIVDGVGGVDGVNGCRAVRLSPDGSCLYASGYGDSAVAWFSRDADTGALRFEAQYKNGVDGVIGLAGVEGIALSPDGTYLFTAGYTDGALVFFSRDTTSGSLSFAGCVKNGDQGITGLAGVKSVAVSPDGRNVYCAGYNEGTLLVFDFQPSTGTLTHLQSLRNGEGGVTLLGGASSVVVSPEGTQVLVAGYTDDSLAVFTRDPASGVLSFYQGFADGQAGCDGLNGADCVEASPDGKSVYVAGYYDNAISVFSRDSVSGALAFSTFVKDGVGGVDGLYYARGVTVSPDGLSAYATGSADDAVALFQRDQVSGALTFRSFTGGIDGSRGLAVSPNGGNCYVASAGGNGLAVLNRERE